MYNTSINFKEVNRMDSLNLPEQLDEKTREIISAMEKEIESRDKEIKELKKQLDF